MLQNRVGYIIGCFVQGPGQACGSLFLPCAYRHCAPKYRHSHAVVHCKRCSATVHKLFVKACPPLPISLNTHPTSIVAGVQLETHRPMALSCLPHNLCFNMKSLWLGLLVTSILQLKYNHREAYTSVLRSVSFCNLEILQTPFKMLCMWELGNPYICLPWPYIVPMATVLP